jgi:hypothetical protein
VCRGESQGQKCAIETTNILLIQSFIEFADFRLWEPESAESAASPEAGGCGFCDEPKGL